MLQSACTAPAVAPVIPLFRPWPQRQWDDLRCAWSGWRDRVRRRAEQRALHQLDLHVLRDLGLAEGAPQHAGATTWIELERPRW